MANQLQQIRSLLGMSTNCNLKQVTITPDIATELLKFNTHNRPRQKKREKEYAADMKEGKFGLQESMISFDSSGVLTNGQTRLYACIMASTNFNTTVYIGLEQNLHMDTGKARNTVDNIQLSGVLDGVIDTNSNSILTVKQLLRLSQGVSRVRDEEVVKFCNKYKKEINSCDSLGLITLHGGKKYLFRSDIAAAFLAAHINGVDLTDLAHIRNVLTDGRSIDSSDIIIQNYRDKVLELGSSKSGTIKKQLYYGAQHTIYCYVNHKKVKLIKLDCEYYPIL